MKAAKGGKVVKGHILVIEKDLKSRVGLSLLIKCFSYEVTTTENSCEGIITLLRKIAFIDAVFLDLTEPHIDTIPPCKWLRKNFPNLWIVAISKEELDAERCLELGVNYCLTLPASMLNINAALKNVPCRRNNAGNI